MDGNARIAPPIELKDKDLASIGVPVHLILGELDRPVGDPMVAAQRAKATLPHGAVTVIAGAGHLMSIEKSEEVNRARWENLKGAGDKNGSTGSGEAQ
jgi:pimeloyl-ACP methyl ester carboxylesterase